MNSSKVPSGVNGSGDFAAGVTVGLWKEGKTYRGTIKAMVQGAEGILVTVENPEPALLDGTTVDAGFMIRCGSMVCMGRNSKDDRVHFIDTHNNDGRHVILAIGDRVEFELDDFPNNDSLARAVRSIRLVDTAFIDGWPIGVTHSGVVTAIDEFDDGRVAHVTAGDRQIEFYSVGDDMQPGQKVEFVIEPTLKWNLV